MNEIYDDFDSDISKFCELLDIKLKPHQKKLIWLSTNTNSFIATIMTDRIARPTKCKGLGYKAFVIDEECLYDE